MGDYESDLSTDEKIIMALVRAAEQYKKESGDIFRKYGLTFSQYNALRVLDASAHGRSTITNVSRTMHTWWRMTCNLPLPPGDKKAGPAKQGHPLFLLQVI